MQATELQASDMLGGGQAVEISQATRPSQGSPSQYANAPPLAFAGGWRQRLTYLAMSLFVAWHTLAIIIAPTPTGSGLVQSLRSLVQPYISFFRLDNQW